MGTSEIPIGNSQIDPVNPRIRRIKNQISRQVRVLERQPEYNANRAGTVTLTNCRFDLEFRFVPITRNNGNPAIRLPGAITENNIALEVVGANQINIEVAVPLTIQRNSRTSIISTRPPYRISNQSGPNTQTLSPDQIQRSEYQHIMDYLQILSLALADVARGSRLRIQDNEIPDNVERNFITTAIGAYRTARRNSSAWIGESGVAGYPNVAGERRARQSALGLPVPPLTDQEARNAGSQNLR